MSTKTLIIFILISISFKIYSQRESYVIDRINIYVYPYSSVVSSDISLTPEYLRNSSKFYISSTDDIFNSSFYINMKKIRSDEYKEVLSSEIRNCRILIDFIDDSQVITSIVVSKNLWFFQNTNSTTIKAYKVNNEFEKIMEDFFSFAMYPFTVNDYFQNYMIDSITEEDQGY